MPTIYVLSKNKKNINIFLAKSHLKSLLITYNEDILSEFRELKMKQAHNHNMHVTL